MVSRYGKLLLILSIPVLLLASGAEHNAVAEQYLKITGRETDFIPRLFNFALLVGLLYYLLANPIKSYLKNRSEAIAKRLEEIEAKRQEAKTQEEKAEKALEEAKVKAKEILEDAKREAELIKAKIKEQTEQELTAMQKICEEKCEVEERKAIRETTAKVLDENITSSDIPLDANKIINIVTKEVA
jgi:F-type H+-transporting ATPase subunit b